MAEPFREPGRAARPHALEERPSLGGQLEADASPIVGRPDTAEKSHGFEPVDVTRERRGGDALLARELAQREARASLDEREERRLVRGDPERLGLPAKVAREAQDRRPQLLGELERRKRSLTNHS